MEAAVKKAQDFFSLVRFSHTLFALPFALASMLIAAEGFPTLKTFLLVLAAMVTARNSAMAFNRLADAAIDAQNPRTANRHLPQKILKQKEVLFFIFINSLLFLTVCYFINSLAFYLSPVALGLIFLYSFSKRWTSLCHFILGFCLAISPVGAWIAVLGTIDWPPLLLAAALLLWVSGFDMIYSTLDVDFDRRMGLFSFPSKFGIKHSLRLALVLHLSMILLLTILGFMLKTNHIYFGGIAAMLGVVIWEHMLARKREPLSMNKAFFNANAVVSLLFLAMIALEELVI